MSKKDRLYYIKRGWDDGYSSRPLNKYFLLDKEKSVLYKEGYRDGCLDSMDERKRSENED